MRYIADLHIHSKFSRATSREMTLDALAYWGKIKGVSLVAAGDFTHPEWLYLCRDRLEPTGNGFFRLKEILPPQDDYLKRVSLTSEDTHFILTAEISFIYSKNGKVRKIHLLVLAPDFASVDKLNHRLSGIGNLSSDGRPILGLDAKDFVKIVADSSPRCVVIPAHIWTPWFSLFGANSGFDNLEECFEEMTPFIFALETGLSSDPAMNWRLPQLDRYALISNSDAHSPSKLGREANAFMTDFSYTGLVRAIKHKDPESFLYTIELFPEEGKYHMDGHRRCKVIFSPQETVRNNYLCPQCQRRLTIGVKHRVTELAQRDPMDTPPDRIPYKNLIPLNEVIGQAFEKNAACQSVWDAYFGLIHEFGDEFTILMETPTEELSRRAPERIARGIERMRNGQVRIVPGYDGAFGVVDLFSEIECAADNSQSKLGIV